MTPPPEIDSDSVQSVPTIKRRRRWGILEKLQLVKTTLDSGMTVSEIARNANIAASLLFKWKHLYETGQLVEKKSTAPSFSERQDEGDPAVMLSEARLYILELEQALGRKTLENEMLKRTSTLKSEVVPVFRTFG